MSLRLAWLATGAAVWLVMGLIAYLACHAR